MSVTTTAKMTSDAFLIWAEQQPKGRYELFRGEVRAMAPERNRHAIVKGNIFIALQDAIQANNLPCRVFPDGVSVIIDDQTVYEPDASLVCDSQIDLDATAIENPSLVVEVTSPSSEKIDSSVKLADYLSLPSIDHMLIVDPVKKIVFHHARSEGPDMLTRILRSGDNLHLKPTGQWRYDLTVMIASFFDGV